MIDRDIHRARALLIESNPLLRSVGVAQLRDLGIGHVATVARVDDARMLLEREPFQIVVCNREFEGEERNGQDLLDELRRERLLPQSTVFLMVASRAEYNQVVEAAEAALDGFLVRPYSAAALATRLTEARQRKRELAEVLGALDSGDLGAALLHALRRFQDRARYWMWCGRLAAELLMSQGRPAEAQRLFAVLAGHSAGAQWAQLGLARALAAQGDVAGARAQLTQLLARDPQAADAHDLVGRLLLEQCDFDTALEHYRRAAEITPGCLLRNQHAGALAFFQGRDEDARRWLARTLALGVQSKLFDALSLMLLAVLHFDRGDAEGAAAMREQLRRWRQRHPASRRLQRFEQAAEALCTMLQGEATAALPALRTIGETAREPHFDLEAANLLLALWARVPAAARPAGEHEALVEQLALRFAASRAIAEVLAAAARREEPAQTLIRRCQARISASGAAGLDRALQGDTAGAMHELLQQGEQTLNRRLLELVGVIAERHGEGVAAAPELAARAVQLLRRCGRAGGAGSHIAGLQRAGRAPGALVLRTPQELAATQANDGAGEEADEEQTA